MTRSLPSYVGVYTRGICAYKYVRAYQLADVPQAGMCRHTYLCVLCVLSVCVCVCGKPCVYVFTLQHVVLAQACMVWCCHRLRFLLFFSRHSLTPPHVLEHLDL